MIVYSAEAGVARIVLNRPEKRNALSLELIDALQTALARASRDPEVRVVVISGAGSDFCAGADLSALNQTAEQGPLDHLASARTLADVFLAIRHHRCPVIAGVRGRALAGGCGLATACDIVLASESAQFGYPEVKIGFVPAMVMAMLRRSISEKLAFELIVMGDVISAAQAQTAGLINRVYPDAELDLGVDEYATLLASKSASAVSLCKDLLYHMDGMNYEAALEAGVHGNALARMTDDARRGIERFVKKS